MSQCLNPNCQQQNSLNDKFCIKCGEKLLLCDRYRAVEYISRGAFGRTFKAIDQQRLNTFCVIKQFAPQNNDPKNIKRAEELFEQEAHRLLELGKHPQIPDLLAYPKQNDRLYLVQEFIDGQDLLKQVNYKGKLTELEVYFFLIDLLPVLDFIHQKNTIHRDIKPENIIHSKNGNLVLIDFGVAKIIKSTMAMGTIAGTVGYSAPEQMFTGRAFPSSDLYSLAVSAIHLLTGCLPTDDQIYNVMKNQWQWREYCQQNKIIINNNLANILDRMLKTSIEERFQSAKEVLKELNNLLDLKKQLELKEIAEAFIKCGDNLDLLKATKNQYDQELAKLGWNYLKENYPQDFQRIMNLVEQEKRSSSFASLNNVQTQQNQFNFTEILAKIDEELKRLKWTNKQKNDHIGVTYRKLPITILSINELLDFWQYLESLPTPQNIQSQSSTIILNRIQQPLIKLVSRKGIDYRKLDQLLAQGKWREADQETEKKILEVIEKNNWVNVRSDDLKNFSKEDLQIMDQLWEKYSQALFGFSVQKQIYINCGGTPGVNDWEAYIRFAEKIGWTKEKKWLYYSDRSFNTNAPLGHLPFVGLDCLVDSERYSFLLSNI